MKNLNRYSASQLILLLLNIKEVKANDELSLILNTKLEEVETDGFKKYYSVDEIMDWIEEYLGIEKLISIIKYSIQLFGDGSDVGKLLNTYLDKNI